MMVKVTLYQNNSYKTLVYSFISHVEGIDLRFHDESFLKIIKRRLVHMTIPVEQTRKVFVPFLTDFHHSSKEVHTIFILLFIRVLLHSSCWLYLSFPYEAGRGIVSMTVPYPRCEYSIETARSPRAYYTLAKVRLVWVSSNEVCSNKKESVCQQ